MNWMCKKCHTINSKQDIESKPLLNPNANANIAVTCRKCGAKSDFGSSKIDPKKIPAEYYNLTIKRGVQILAWIEQGGNLGISSSNHSSGVCHALVVDWLKRDLQGQASKFIRHFA